MVRREDMILEQVQINFKLYQTILFVAVQFQKTLQFEIGYLRYYQIFDDLES